MGIECDHEWEDISVPQWFCAKCKTVMTSNAGNVISNTPVVEV